MALPRAGSIVQPRLARRVIRCQPAGADRRSVRRALQLAATSARPTPAAANHRTDGSNLPRDPRSEEDRRHPAPARQAAPVLRIGRVDWMAEPGAPYGRGRRGRGRRAHHVRVGRSERVLRVLQDAAGLAGARVSPAGWIAGQGPAPRLRARVAGYLDDQPRGGGARARRGVPGCAGVRLAGSAHAPARCGRRHAQQRDQQAPRGWPRRENTCPHGRWTHPVTGRFPSPAPAGDPARLPGGTPPPGGAPPGETGAIWVRRR